MRIHINPSDGVPIYLQIINQIKYQIASGRLSPDQQLPPVRKLAEDLTINPNTVARAYRDLEQEGLVTTRRGAGVFIADGQSPLARREQLRILGEKAESLLISAQQMNFSLDEIIDLLRDRSRQVQLPEKDGKR